VERIGATGVGALTRVMGFLILAIGVELVVHGVLAVA
jgi:multiple antibiotic resistance protein